MRKVRKLNGKLIVIGHIDNDIDKDARELSTLEIEKPYRNDPKFAIIHVDDRKILVKNIPPTKFPFDTNDLGEFNFHTKKGRRFIIQEVL